MLQVSIRAMLDTWLIVVKDPSIYNTVREGCKLHVWVQVSWGVTQWARWQKNTGDPDLTEKEQDAPAQQVDDSCARGKKPDSNRSGKASNGRQCCASDQRRWI